MKPVNQTIFDNELGDCIRACIASIFEFPIEKMPNFWEQTQSAMVFWELLNNWTTKELNHKCIVVNISNGHAFYIRGLLCIALCEVKSNSEIDHAVIWCDKLIHDPHPYSNGDNIKQPRYFVIFSPIELTINSKSEKQR